MAPCWGRGSGKGHPGATGTGQGTEDLDTVHVGPRGVETGGERQVGGEICPCGPTMCRALMGAWGQRSQQHHPRQRCCHCAHCADEKLEVTATRLLAHISRLGEPRPGQHSGQPWRTAQDGTRGRGGCRDRACWRADPARTRAPGCGHGDRQHRKVGASRGSYPHMKA